mgnify:CR=1 FL=1
MKLFKFLKPWLVLAGGVFLGKWIAGFVVKEGPDDPTGFIEAKPGIGLDDFAEIGSIVVGIAFVTMIVGR